MCKQWINYLLEFDYTNFAFKIVWAENQNYSKKVKRKETFPLHNYFTQQKIKPSQQNLGAQSTWDACTL